MGNKFFPGKEGGKWKMCQKSKNPPISRDIMEKSGGS